MEPVGITKASASKVRKRKANMKAIAIDSTISRIAAAENHPPPLGVSSARDSTSRPPLTSLGPVIRFFGVFSAVISRFMTTAILSDAQI
jgi:hypothetical protein